ncbi:MAG TPA: hotdog domain-containing protein [Acidimicrobiales bacterium]|nr:hotdog domain-containing protein [Acidimicrobiales bacterium]
MSIEIGLTGRATLAVTQADTADTLRSGEVPVLATPRLVGLCEEACVQAIRGELQPGLTTVGMRVQFDHLAPTGVGSSVTAEATLEKVEGRRLTFTVAANDAGGLVGAGKLTRVVVEVEPFLKKAH